MNSPFPGMMRHSFSGMPPRALRARSSVPLLLSRLVTLSLQLPRRKDPSRRLLFLSSPAWQQDSSCGVYSGEYVITATLEMISRHSPAWMRRARCAEEGSDPQLFFPEPGEEDSAVRTEAAQRVCKSCPVRTQCLMWAFETGDRWAILGGLTANQRTRVRGRVRRHAMGG